MNFDWNAVLDGLTSVAMLKAAWTTVWLAVVAEVLGLCLGLLAALARLSAFAPLRRLASFYIWVIRGTPLLVQLVVIYTGLPQVGVKLGVIESALIALVVNEGAYLAEIIRAGITSVPSGQTEAARALGMKYVVTMHKVVIPQAARLVIPPIGNNFNALLKATSLASVISLHELLRQTEMLVQVNFRVLELYLVCAAYYLAMTTIWGIMQGRIESRLAPQGSGGRRRPVVLEVAEHA